MKILIQINAMLVSCLLATLANAEVTQVSPGYEVSYSIYLPVGAVPTDQDIHHVFIFEWSESQQEVDFVFEIAGSDRTVLSHVTPFVPTAAFVIGFIDPVPGAIEGSNDAKRHLYTLVDPDFSDSLVENDLGKLFSVRFGQGEQVTIDLMIDASDGSEEALDQLWDFVRNSPMAEAAFDPAGGFRIHKWSIITPPIEVTFENGFETP